MKNHSTLETLTQQHPTHHRTVKVDGLDIFYREAGPQGAPVVLLMHGWPSSSRMFRNLIPLLADQYHVIAPDYPGFGHSAAPDRAHFRYSFDELGRIMEGFLAALSIQSFALHIMDFGGPVGFRLMLKEPSRMTALIVQNAPGHPDEGPWWETLAEYWKTGTAEKRREARKYIAAAETKNQYVVGVKDQTLIDPDNWLVDLALMQRPGLDEIHLDLLYDIRNNVAVFKAAREYLRAHQPPVLIASGANDEIFPGEAISRYLEDVPQAEMHLLETGHFALEDKCEEIGALMHDFLDRRVPRPHLDRQAGTGVAA